MSGRAPIKSYTSFIPPPVKVGYAHYIFQGLPSCTVMHCTNCFQVQGRAEYSPDGRRDLSNGEPGEVAETYDREYGIHFAELETGYLEQISSLGAEVKQYQERIISLEEEIVRLNVILKDRESVLPPHSSPGVHLRAPRSMVCSLLMQMNHTNLVPIRLFRHIHVTGLGPQLTVQPRSPCSLRVARTAPLPSELTWISLIVSEFWVTVAVMQISSPSSQLFFATHHHSSGAVNWLNLGSLINGLMRWSRQWLQTVESSFSP